LAGYAILSPCEAARIDIRASSGCAKTTVALCKISPTMEYPLVGAAAKRGEIFNHE
jgi:hypothetical protein